MPIATIKDYMTPGCKWISPNASVTDAARLMRDLNIGFLPVAENDRMIGTLTDRDIALQLANNKRDIIDIPVREIMSRRVFYCFDDQNPDAVVQNMAAMQVRRLPVVNRAKRLIGVISFADLAQGATPMTYINAQKQLAAKPVKSAIRAANTA